MLWDRMGRLYLALETLWIKQRNIFHYNDMKVLYSDKNSISITVLEHNGKYLGPFYIMPFSYENGMEVQSYENGIV